MASRVRDHHTLVKSYRHLRAAMVAVSKGGPAIRPASNEN
jgi:hypothetical protein